MVLDRTVPVSRQGKFHGQHNLPKHRKLSSNRRHRYPVRVTGVVLNVYQAGWQRHLSGSCLPQTCIFRIALDLPRRASASPTAISSAFLRSSPCPSSSAWRSRKRRPPPRTPPRTRTSCPRTSRTATRRRPGPLQKEIILRLYRVEQPLSILCFCK